MLHCGPVFMTILANAFKHVLVTVRLHPWLLSLVVVAVMNVERLFG